MTTLGRHPDALAVKLTVGDGAHLVASTVNGWAGPVTLHYGPKTGDPVISDAGTVDGDEVSWTLTEEQVEARAEHDWARLEDNGVTLAAGRVLVWTGGLGSTATQTIASLTAGPPGPQGPAGPQGPQGEVGPQGPQGEQGETGPTGPTAVSADAGNLLKLGTDNLLMLDPDDLPAGGGGGTTVQIGTVTLPEDPAEGLPVSVLADSTTVFPEDITWDSGGEPTVTGRLLVTFVWSGTDWVGTYGPPIPAAPGAAGLTLVFQSTASGTVDTTTVTNAGLDVGDPSANRTVVVVVAWQAASVARECTAATIGGVSATLDVTSGSLQSGAAVFRATVPTGTTADVVTTWNGTTSQYLVAVLSSPAVLAVVDTDFAQVSTGISTATLTLTSVAGGAVVAGAAARGSTTDFTWSGVTQVADGVGVAAAAGETASTDVSVTQTWIGTAAGTAAAATYQQA